MAVTGCDDGNVRVWDLSSRTQVGEPMAGHRRTGWVRAVAAGTLLGRRVAVTGENDLRVWDLVARKQIGEPLLSDDASVEAVALDQPDGCLMAAMACTDQSVTICDLQTRQAVARLSLSEQPTAVAYMNGTLLIAMGHEIAVYQVSV